MPDVGADIDASLRALGYADWTVSALRGDASARRFFRLSNTKGQTAIAMHTPAHLAESQAAFLQIGGLLRAGGLCAPHVLAMDDIGGLLILEDLGPNDLADACKSHPEHEWQMYKAAIEVLLRVATIPAPEDLPCLTADSAAQMLDPFFDHAVPDTEPVAVAAIKEEVQRLFANHLRGTGTLALRDYHAQNLIWRADRTGTDRIGLIDFQDAVTAPAGYDLVSLLRDARRDVSTDTYDKAMNHYAEQTNTDISVMRRNSAILGVQRNLRIIGIFFRLADQGKPGYLDLVPRVVGLVRRDLGHSSLTRLASAVGPLLETCQT